VKQSTDQLVVVGMYLRNVEENII